MAKNKIQFQKGMSLVEFFQQYGQEEQCRDQFFKWRWANGFECPLCCCREYCTLKTRELYQCNRCRHQTSLTSGTILEASKLPFTTWFLGMYLMTQTKNGISALELSRQLGISYNASWRLKHKLMQAQFRLCVGKPSGSIFDLKNLQLRTYESLDIASSPGIAVNTLSRPL